MSAGDTITILFLASNPSNTVPLDLNRELRGIKQALQLSPHRNRFDLQITMATRLDDMRRAMLAKPPRIVHFAGHGEEGEIYLEDNGGEKFAITAGALAGFFKLFPALQCVLLNACYSDDLAAALVKHVPYVIGMRSAVQDKAAIAFAEGFYDALGAGLSFGDAFEVGKSTVEMNGLLDADTPVLKSNPDAKPQPTPTPNPAVNTEVPAPALPVPEIARLSGPQYKALHSAMLEAYNAESLSGMAQFDLGVKLSNVAGGSDFSAVTFNFIDWAQRNGRLGDLLQAAMKSGNKQLQTTIAKLPQIT